MEEFENVLIKVKLIHKLSRQGAIELLCYWAYLNF